MLVDWITARVPLQNLSAEAREVAFTLGDRITRYCPKSGEVRFTSTAWDSIRSDSHQVTVRAGSDLWIQGSPARVIGDGDSVFSSGPAAQMDLRACVQSMADFVSRCIGVPLPPWQGWTLTRVDVTANLALDSLADVRVALRVLRDCEGGRYRVSQKAGDSVYWSPQSRLRKAKAYAKGPHLEYLRRQRSYTGRQYTAEEVERAGRLLRLELTLGREFWARNDWQGFTGHELAGQWDSYFGRMIGDAEMTKDADLRERIVAAAKTPGRGKAAYGCWLLIQSEGWERAREAYNKATWYRHLGVIRAAGLGDADIAAGRVVELRRKVLDARMVTSWAELEAA